MRGEWETESLGSLGVSASEIMRDWRAERKNERGI